MSWTIEQIEPFEQTPRLLRVGFGLHRVLAEDIERPQLTVLHRLEHLAQMPSAFVRNRSSVGALELGVQDRILDVLPADELVRDRAHVAAALDVVLSAQRDQAGAVASDMAGEQCEVDDRQHVVDRVVMLGDPKRPADLGTIGASVGVRQLANDLGADTGDPLRIVQRVGFDGGFVVFEIRRSLAR